MTDPRVLVPLLLIAESLHYVLARMLVPHLPPAAAGFYVLAVATVEIGLVAGRRLQMRIVLRHWVFFCVIGALVAINTNLGFVAVKFIDPGTAALLTRTSVIFGVALGVLWLRERLTRPEAIGALLAVAGAGLVSFQAGDYLRLGSLLVISASFLYALHAAVVKRFGGSIPFLDFFFFRVAGTAAFLFLLTVAQGALRWPSAEVWGLLVLTATVDVVISRALYYVVLRRLDMSIVTIVLTLSPVVTMLWSLILFGTIPTWREILGGLAILAGVVVVSTSRAGGLDRRRP